MTPEEVPEDLVEKAVRAIYSDYVARYPEDPPVHHAGPGQPVWRHIARAALAAVLPEVQAEARRSAEKERDEMRRTAVAVSQSARRIAASRVSES